MNYVNGGDYIRNHRRFKKRSITIELTELKYKN